MTARKTARIEVPWLRRKTPEFKLSTCGYCEFEECDGSLRWQCVSCALADALTGHVMLLAEKDKESPWPLYKPCKMI